MTIDQATLRKILRVGHETSMRGSGISMNEALGRVRYAIHRSEFGPKDLLPILRTDPSLAEEWLSYSGDKRTAGGWYLQLPAEIGRVGAPGSILRFRTIEEAIAEYVVRELDFWAGIEHSG